MSMSGKPTTSDLPKRLGHLESNSNSEQKYKIDRDLLFRMPTLRPKLITLTLTLLLLSNIAYAPSAGRRLLKHFAPSSESSYPQTMGFAVHNGKADHIVNAGVFSRPACSEIPPD